MSKWDPLNKYVLLILILIQCFYYFHTLTRPRFNFHAKILFSRYASRFAASNSHTHTGVHSIALWFYFVCPCRYRDWSRVLLLFVPASVCVKNNSNNNERHIKPCYESTSARLKFILWACCWWWWQSCENVRYWNDIMYILYEKKRRIRLKCR